MCSYERARNSLVSAPRRWLITGAAGFIGSHLVDALLRLDQDVIGLDNYATGRRERIPDLLSRLSSRQAARFRMVEADIRDLHACRAAFAGVDVVLHQAALGSVPRSIKDPLTTHEVNVTGFVNILLASRDAGVRRIVFASSSSVYGDHPALPKVESAVGRPLSPYATSKRADELYAEAFRQAYGLATVGLRYFNVFGPNQDPHGPYAAVMPKWFKAVLAGETVIINGDGETSRDFCFVENVVQANVLAALVELPEALGHVYNIACGQRTTLNELFSLIRDELARVIPHARRSSAAHGPFRDGDVRHSLADISKARTLLGYEPQFAIRDGLALTAKWYAQEWTARNAAP